MFFTLIIRCIHCSQKNRVITKNIDRAICGICKNKIILSEKMEAVQCNHCNTPLNLNEQLKCLSCNRYPDYLKYGPQVEVKCIHCLRNNLVVSAYGQCRFCQKRLADQIDVNIKCFYCQKEKVVHQGIIDQVKCSCNRLISGIDSTDRMSGEQFETYLGKLFSQLGFDVQKTPKTGDFGVDLILQKNNEKIAVQAKRYKLSGGHIGQRGVREVIAGKMFYGCTQGWVVTNAYFSVPAINLAQKIGVELIDRKWLAQIMGWLAVNNNKQVH